MTSSQLTLSQEIVWSGKTGTMVLKGIPDLRAEWWWEEFAERPGSHLEENRIDWTKELGGWDLMDLLNAKDEMQPIWLSVDANSYSFT